MINPTPIANLHSEPPLPQVPSSPLNRNATPMPYPQQKPQEILPQNIIPPGKFPKCNALSNLTCENLFNALITNPIPNTYPQHEPLQSTPTTTTNPFSKPLSLQVSSSPLHRNGNPTSTPTNAADITRPTSEEPISATFSICPNDNDQHLNDNDRINHNSSNTSLNNVLNNQTNLNDYDINNHNSSNISLNNVLNNQTNHTIFLNEYNDELFQTIPHREVISAFSRMQTF